MFGNGIYFQTLLIKYKSRPMLQDLKDKATIMQKNQGS